ncbi:MAG: papain-like cysteine protease family protein [Bacteroidota bacterium]|jgi:hypothetical protein
MEKTKTSLKNDSEVGSSVSNPTYQQMPFGFNGCNVNFGPIMKNVSLQNMIDAAISAKSLGFAYCPPIQYGCLIIGDYPNACTSSPALSWQLFLKTNQLNVPLFGQQTNMWCWAATCQMTVAYQGVNITQCAEANQLFNRTDCCNSPVPSQCVQGGWPQYQSWGFSSQTTPWGTALTFDQLVAQIDANLPTNFSWGWTGGGGHIMVARGYKNVNGVNYVYINDPWPPNKGETRWITYAEYVSSNSHTHWMDYYNIKKN